ncbi:MAG TPA: hypothetical protein VGC39_00530, partial [Candidatus Methylacidiphilales bacterium]
MPDPLPNEVLARSGSGQGTYAPGKLGCGQTHAPRQFRNWPHSAPPLTGKQVPDLFVLLMGRRRMGFAPKQSQHLERSQLSLPATQLITAFITFRTMARQFGKK